MKPKTVPKTNTNLRPVLDRFWGPKWVQNRTKKEAKNGLKCEGRLGSDFNGKRGVDYARPTECAGLAGGFRGVNTRPRSVPKFRTPSAPAKDRGGRIQSLRAFRRARDGGRSRFDDQEEKEEHEEGLEEKEEEGEEEEEDS